MNPNRVTRYRAMPDDETDRQKSSLSTIISLFNFFSPAEMTFIHTVASEADHPETDRQAIRNVQRQVLQT